MTKPEEKIKKENITEIFFDFNGGKRRVRVFVPDNNGEKLPVVYMTDGQNLFFEKDCVWGCWHTIEAVEEAMKNGFGGAVIVGIDHGEEKRDNELTPAGIGAVNCPEKMEHFTAPQGELFDDFMMNTVKPYVESRFNVKTGRQNTAVCGSSSGGLQAFFAGMEHPESFCAAGVFSPAMLLYSEDDIRAYVFRKLRPEMPYMYFYTGCGDELEERIFKSTESTYDILTESGYPLDCLNEVVMLDYKHNEKAWAEIFRDFLQTFLSKTKE